MTAEPAPRPPDGEDREWAAAPEVVYLPGTSTRREDGLVEVVVREVGEAEFVIHAFTTLDALVQSRGGGEPWVALPAAAVEDLRAQLDAVVLLDGPS